MGTEQQQEFKSEKPLPKPQRKSIPFTDKAIENWKPKNSREQRGFPRTNTANGLKIAARKNLKDKYWKLEYYLNKKRLSLSLGPFIPSVRGTEAITKEMLKLISSHKDLRRTHWLTDPKNTYKERDEAILKEDQQKEDNIKRKEELKKALVSVNSVIESLCIAGFPKVKIKDEFLSKLSIRTHINFLIGSNERIKHLSYSEDREGNGKIFFKPGGPQSFPELFQKYPSGVGIKKSPTGEVSLYDTETGARPIRELTNIVVDQYLRSKDRSQGQQENILLALQCLWTFACKENVFGEDVPNNPTSRRDKRIFIMRSRDSKAPGRAYNDAIFKRTDIPILIKAFEYFTDEYPFYSEALNLACVAGRREPETLKLRYDMITKDSEGNPIILMPGGIVKVRGKKAIINITPSVQLVLDRLKKHLEGPYKAYSFVPYLFPTTRINKVSLSEHTYLNSDQTRIKNWDGCWRAVEKLTGIKGSPKMFRKTKSTYDEEDFVKRYGKKEGQENAIILSDHKEIATAQKHYWKVSDSKRKELADISDKLFTFPRVVKA
jgi:hypothetical protein